MKDGPYTDRVIELVKSFMDGNNLNYSKIAAVLERNGKPMTRQGFFKMVKNGSLRVATLMEALDAFGMEIRIEKKGE